MLRVVVQAYCVASHPTCGLVTGEYSESSSGSLLPVPLVKWLGSGVVAWGGHSCYQPPALSCAAISTPCKSSRRRMSGSPYF